MNRIISTDATFPSGEPRFVEPNVDAPELPLLGGDVTEGLVRIGETVRRPHGAASDAVRRLLVSLAHDGFGGVPRFLGIDDAQREVLSYIDGEVASRPWPTWMADDERIVSVARLLRAYDDAALRLGVPEWAEGMRHTDPPGTPASVAGDAELVGHLDVTPENVVFRDGRAHALIDFDLAKPATRVEEICNMLLWWAPLMPRDDREHVLRGVDPFRRATLLVDAYGPTEEERMLIVPVAINQAERSWHLMKHRSETLGGGWRRMWEDGVGERIERRQVWLAAHRRELEAAVCP